MIWIGNFKSLQSALLKTRPGAPLEVHTWLHSEIGLISPFADWLMSLIARSGCVRGKEEFVELALREAVSNAILHGNRMDARKLVHVRCCCEGTKGVLIVVRDQGDGFDSNNVPNPLAVENLGAEHGRGIHLIKLAVDEVSFERGGTEVHIRKKSGSEQKTPAQRMKRMVPRLIRRPWPGVRAVEFGRRPFVRVTPTGFQLVYFRSARMLRLRCTEPYLGEDSLRSRCFAETCNPGL
jgi:serine/threonine-protein kinase RsbW